MKLFVYGTLMRNHALHSNLGKAKFVSEEVLEGFEMHDLGAYPCILNTGNSEDKVYGEVYNIQAPQLRALDCVEGVPYLFKRIKVDINGEDVYAYEYSSRLGKPNNRIPSGKWEGVKYEDALHVF